MKRSMPFLIALLILWLLAAPASAESGPIVVRPDQDLPVDGALRQAIVDSLSTALNETYVFPEVAAKMEKEIRGNLKKGKYDGTATIAEFAMLLMDDVRGVSHDLHLGVIFMPDEEIARMLEGEEEEEARRTEEMRATLRRENFRFKKVEILDGNVGYLRLDNFIDTRLSGPTAVAAMNFLGNCDALIIDLRQNGGGSPSLIQLMMGYLLGEPTHLNSFYIRKEDRTDQFWSSPYAPGGSLAEVDLYVLIGPRTGSAAEEFAYNVQSLKRGTLIGESTWGGAHPVDRFVWKSLHVGAQIPFGRAVNPITGTNWEGVGVLPDMEIGAERALDVAHLEALKKIRERTDDPLYAERLDWAIQGLELGGKEVEIDDEVLASYAGVYEDRVIENREGTLFYRRGEMPERRMTPLSPALFTLEGIEGFRLEVVTDESGSPVMLRGHYAQGMTDESRRTGALGEAEPSPMGEPMRVRRVIQGG
ncbi:MAG: S41 family peptidase [Candidatus Eisenbacteria bacterium]